MQTGAQRIEPEEIAERELPFPGLLNAMVHHSSPGASATKLGKLFSMGPDFHNFKSPQELFMAWVQIPLGVGLFRPFSEPIRSTSLIQVPHGGATLLIILLQICLDVQLETKQA